ncbi:MAG: divalent cation tolerance protein CutA [Alphaproteobacteria bacterium]|nr:divalent cation tolerance protein CutA [Alphaproteobacteria bacterium]
MEKAVVFYTTWPDAGAAERCGRDLLARRLAACVNIGPEITSLYRWREAVETGRETVMLVKTVARQAESTRDAILAQHPYETPCVLAFDASTATSSFAFLGWLSSEIA